MSNCYGFFPTNQDERKTVSTKKFNKIMNSHYKTVQYRKRNSLSHNAFVNFPAAGKRIHREKISLQLFCNLNFLRLLSNNTWKGKKKDKITLLQPWYQCNSWRVGFLRANYVRKFRYLRIKTLDVELSQFVSISTKRQFLWRRLWTQANDSFVKMIHAITLKVNWFFLTSTARNSPQVRSRK